MILVIRRWVCALAVIATALVTPGCALGKGHKHPHRTNPSQSRTGPWRPLREQSADAATTFFFNPAVARTQTPGNGGFMMGNNAAGDVPWRANSGVVVVPGRFHSGVQSTNPRYGYLWMPSTGILSPTAFTIEFWVKSAVPFSSATGVPVGVSGVQFSLGNGYLHATFANSDRYPPVTATVLANVRSLPANTWENVALTYSRGQLLLYVNGVRAARDDGVPAPQVWSDGNRSSGLTVAGANGKGATNLAVSDLRISRVARVPGRRTGPVPSTLNVSNATAGGRIRQTLLGGLHTLTTPATERMARGVIRVIRTDKLINSTPIKLGAPDAAHPSAGVSGAFSYNWAVVDRTMAYLRRLGVAPYLSVDATPQVLGGSDPPFAAPLLRTARSYQAAFPSQVPDNLQAWQQIVHDLAFHILRQDHTAVAYWGVWNEPDGAFWAGTLSQYLALYQATVQGVRAADPRAVVGGADTAGFDLPWVSALISFCASQHLPLNFVSWHYYTGDLGDIQEAQSAVTALARHSRIPAPLVNIGEWAWQPANLPGTGAPPFRYENYFLNDWSAAFAGASLIEMQRDGVQTSIYTNPVAPRNATGFKASGLMSPSAPWANFNVFLLWHKLAGRVARTTLSADPGVFAIAAKSGHQLSTLVASLHYQLGGRYPLTVQFPRQLAGKQVRVWLIDRNHADAYDAGPAHARLHPISQKLSPRAQLQLSLPARAVLLIEESGA